MACDERAEERHLLWFVLHTRPRCEKKLAAYCQTFGIHHSLPLYRSVKSYQRKRVVFLKPLFPGYVFLRPTLDQKRSLFKSDCIANWLEIFDQDLFTIQLEAILAALETDYEIRLAPTIQAGTQVRIKSGPLQGLTAWVDNRMGMETVLLRLDFIGEAASVKIGVDLLEPC